MVAINGIGSAEQTRCDRGRALKKEETSRRKRDSPTFLSYSISVGGQCARSWVFHNSAPSAQTAGRHTVRRRVVCAYQITGIESPSLTVVQVPPNRQAVWSGEFFRVRTQLVHRRIDRPARGSDKAVLNKRNRRASSQGGLDWPVLT